MAYFAKVVSMMREQRRWKQAMRVIGIELAIAAGPVFLCGFNSAAEATNITTPTLSTQTWTPAGSPYTVYCDVTIPAGSTLTIKPGVTINFMGHHYLHVRGSLMAVGTSAQNIVFTAQNTTVGWNGIRFDKALTPSNLTYCDIRYAKKTGAAANDNGGAVYVLNYHLLSIDHCTFAYNATALNGGAIYTNSSNIVITGSSFEQNTAGGRGGGLCIDTFGIIQPYVYDNEFNDNSAQNGGAIACYMSSVWIEDNYIHDNTASIDGGGIYLDDMHPYPAQPYPTSATEVVNNVIELNFAGASGGGVATSCYFYAPRITANEIESNRTLGDGNAGEGGGGIGCRGFSYGSSILMAGVLADDNTLEGNSTTGNGGGILFGEYSIASASNNLITRNVASAGGGMYCADESEAMGNTITHNDAATRGGGVCCGSDCQIEIINCLITANTSQGWGGGICSDDYGAYIINTTISDNAAPYGGGLYCLGQPALYNSILYLNGADAGVHIAGSPDPVFTNCDVQGGYQAFTGVGSGSAYNAAAAYLLFNNINADPRFVVTGANPYALKGGIVSSGGFSSSIPPSPCIDAGTLALPAGLGLPATDLAGQPRISHAKVDIGAYEHQFPLVSRTRL